MKLPIASLMVACLAAAAAVAGEVRLSVAEPSGVERQQWPVSSGIPLAQGALQDDPAAALFDEAGKEIALQTECLARWGDGSVRWLLLDFQCDLAANEKKTLTLRYGQGVHRTAVEKPVQVTKQDKGKVTIETGPLRLIYNPKEFFPQGEAYLTAGNRQLTINCGADGVLLVKDKDSPFYPLAAKAEADLTTEQSGPVRTCIRVSGWHESPAKGKMFRYIARIHAWRGQPYVRVFYTFVNDQQDGPVATIQKLELRFWSGAGWEYKLLDGTSSNGGRLFQSNEGQYSLDGKVAENHGCGWAAVGSERGGLAVGLREFWQNWPKAISCQGGCIRIELCPKLPKEFCDGKTPEEERELYYYLRGGMYTFKTGVAKTHELWINYLSGKPDAKRLGAFFQATEDPLLAVAEPAYVGSTKAMGDLPPADPQKFAGYDDWFGRAFDNHLKRRDKDREYGMLNYGDWYGERKVNWGNLEYDLAHGMFIQYLRTGDRRYFLRGEQAARHHIDVDVVHATNPLMKNPWGEPPQVGDIWLHCLGHTGGYYDDAALPVEKTYQMGHSTNFGHVWVGGDFEYYYLTGDRRAREVGIEIADAMARHCPTQYSDHIRGLGWPIVLLLNAYEATGEKKYLDAATSNWEVLKKNIVWEKGWVVRLAKGHCMHPERTCYGNVPFMEGLTVSALARYHRITKDPDVLRAISAGVDQMIRECWVEEDKAFRYTACPLSTPKVYEGITLAAEGMAYEAALTGNREHLRVLKEGLREALRKTGSGVGKGLAQFVHFMPWALRALEDEERKP
ncbi:MAG: hypothetical protein NTW87_20945 [Planctomycetota bacterium]|nr:hypothetical protein [Planctomycetota bacterium]